MSAPEQAKLPLPDVQRTPDTREVRIKRVGVTNIRMPIRLKRRHHGSPGSLFEPVDTVGVFELAVSLPALVKGTHMSRFTEVLNSHIDGGGVFSCEDLQKIARELAVKLEADEVFVALRAEYFVQQNSPVTERKGMAPLIGLLEVSVIRTASEDNDLPAYDYFTQTRTGIEIEGKTCCPCSKEISDYDPVTERGKGAHAQRGKIFIMVEHQPQHTIYFENLVDIAWRAFSVPCYPVLKRPDERHVTMDAYANPKFVEDVVRDVACQLRQVPTILGFSIRVQNAESIHYHDAFAEVEE